MCEKSSQWREIELFPCDEWGSLVSPKVEIDQQKRIIVTQKVIAKLSKEKGVLSKKTDSMNSAKSFC